MSDEIGRIPVTAIHLDAVGGVAGDMFAAALLDIRPDLWPRCEAAIAAMDLPGDVRVGHERHDDGTLTGTQFKVDDVRATGNGNTRKDPAHVTWTEIRARLEAAPLDAAVRDAAIGIFELLAAAEARVHGTSPGSVSFHEVGAVDSIVDILCAAAIATALSPCAWTVGPLPRGRGQVRTAHGFLPVPGPAVLELLKGYAFADDGEEGERVTPTGAAILRYLNASQEPDPTPRRLVGAGVGFGTRRLAARSNILRASLYGPVGENLAGDSVAVLRCEIDDQTGEDLAAAIDRLRQAAGVIDVCQWAVFGKKGRLGVALQVLAEPGRADAIAALMLDETTTLGVRKGIAARTLIRRETTESAGLPVKLAHRPSGVSAKAEMDALAATPGFSRRQRRRQAAETRAVDGGEDKGDE